ncbi:hypothetical protein CK203_057392 [Vitis vinifera]|uniref:Uncharacterized protein n=1 Tax=Vitis vinifera TaxID=29760 RepID=A0A438FUH9_VITVI|nr:hypothetical protein CK203_057392 [Vitis vinifera]
MHEPEEIRDTSDLRAGLLRSHRPWAPPLPLANKVCPERAQLDAAGSSAAAMVQADAPRPSSTAAAQLGTTAFDNAPTVVETHASEGIPDASNGEEALDEKSSPTAAVPPNWEEFDGDAKGSAMLHECGGTFHEDVRLLPSDQTCLCEYGWGPPAFVKARLPFGTPESVISCIQYLQEWMIPETAEVVVAGIPLHDATREQLFKWLEEAEAMRAFISQHPGDIEKLCTRLEKVEAKLTAARKAVADGTEQLAGLKGKRRLSGLRLTY